MIEPKAISSCALHAHAMTVVDRELHASFAGRSGPGRRGLAGGERGRFRPRLPQRHRSTLNPKWSCSAPVRRQQFPPREALGGLLRQGIGVEAMDNAAAQPHLQPAGGAKDAGSSPRSCSETNRGLNPGRVRGRAASRLRTFGIKAGSRQKSEPQLAVGAGHGQLAQLLRPSSWIWRTRSRETPRSRAISASEWTGVAIEAEAPFEDQRAGAR